MDLTRCSVNSMTVPQLGLRELAEAAVARGIGWVAPWRHLLADAGGAVAASKILGDHGLQLSSLCRGGMFTAPDARARRMAVDENRRAIDEAAALGADTLVLVCGGVVEKDVTGSMAMVRDGIAAVLDHAEQAGVSLGIEPLHPMMALDRSVVARIDDALAIIGELGNPAALGLVVDAYHVWWDTGIEAQLRRTDGRILGFHVSDWVSPLTGPLTGGRAMMGDGCIDLPRLARLVGEAGYHGPVEVEVISEELSARAPDLLLDTVVQRFEEAV